jgi:ATP-dependent exoDNAse (exonuclease V) beta subunit
MKEYRIDKRLQKKLMRFKKKILNIMSKLNNNRVHDIVYEIIKSLHLRRYLKNDSSSLEKMDMLLEKISEFEEEYTSFGIEKYTLKEFLEQMSFFIEDKDSLGKGNKVNLMTIHQAKGLEFKYVFIVGLEEGFYPLSFYENGDDLEEERRILYVAITRAKEKCYISYANERIIEKEKVKRNPSRFISEINNKELVEIYKSYLFDENIEERNIEINNNASQKNDKESINKKENKIDVRINSINDRHNNENKINSIEKSNDNRNNNNSKFIENKDLQNEEKEINNLLSNYLISKEIFELQENEVNNVENLGNFKYMNKKRKLSNK